MSRQDRPWTIRERKRLMHWRLEPDMSLEELAVKTNRTPAYLRQKLRDLRHEVRLKLARLAG